MMKRFGPLPHSLKSGTVVLLAAGALYLGGKLSTIATVAESLPTLATLEGMQLQFDEVRAEWRDRQQDYAKADDVRVIEQAILQRLDALEVAGPVGGVASLQDLTALAARLESTEGLLQVLKSRVDSSPPLPSSPAPTPGADALSAAASAPDASATSGAESASSPPSEPVVKKRRPARTTSGSPVPVKSARLPFILLGMESRGGETFLAVAPMGFSRLGDIQLLRPESVFLGWRLRSLEPGKAHFVRPNGTSLIVSLG
ncbi:hypothetical protein HX882_20910 [Pseudomonas gingeri]|uniref:Uncharacterized protein n=1 Tax=Pseudomonas gingeri TaxID=117681 RepID=A0A7Y7XEI9_9PSED|nr:hypothetical protein [Pseudomonas gingeri]NWB98362.1 hypothetical protein [Pseudomonas gingeri]